jgi:hypothetical protein
VVSVVSTDTRIRRKAQDLCIEDRIITSPEGPTMLDHLTTEFLANDHRASLRNDANGLRRSRLSRLRRSTRGRDRAPTDQR